MTLQYGWLMWGVPITTANRDLIVNFGAGDVTAVLAITATIDGMPTGDGSTFDLLEMLKDALETADPSADTYTVAFETDPVRGMTGKIVITNDSANTFEIKWPNVGTTIDPRWFGFFDGLGSAGASTYTSRGRSILTWLPEVPFDRHNFEPRPINRTFQTESLDFSKIVTSRVASGSKTTRVRTFAAMAGFAATSFDVRGVGRLRVSSLDERLIFESETINDSNDALVHWWNHASQGKWFAVFDENASPGIAFDTHGNWARLQGQEIEGFTNIVLVRDDMASPVLYDVDFNYRIIARNDLAADGG